MNSGFLCFGIVLLVVMFVLVLFVVDLEKFDVVVLFGDWVELKLQFDEFVVVLCGYIIEQLV